MSEVARLVDQFERAMDDGPWHGDPVLEILSRVTFEQADRKPSNDAHSIREIVRHMTAWTHEVRNRMNGAVAAEPPGGDWPQASGTGEAAWRAEVAALKAANDAIIADLQALDEPRLLEPINDARFDDGKGVTRYVLLHGLVQHHAYHSGQVAILSRIC